MVLINYGFEEVGKWTKENLKNGITFELCKFEKERVVYTFLVDCKIMYLGICNNTTTTLKDRMNRYKYRSGKGTNERIADKIKKCLEQGKCVKIFALKLESTLQYKDLNIDLVKGLENPLIEKLKPDWNIQNVRRKGNSRS